MDYKEWEPIYKKILKDFGYSEEKDIKAAKIASNISKNLKKASIKELEEAIQKKVVTVCGAAMDGNDIKKIDGVVIAADEATTFLLKNSIIPDIITTDLDGSINDLIKANEKGSIAIIHAHGDNIDAIKKWLVKFKGKVMITTQSKPFDMVYNFGGFTDGDRAYCMAKHFKARKINLIGFNFEKPKPKKGKKVEIKRKKLVWAKKIINYG